MSLLLLVSALVFMDALPDALPDAVEQAVVVAVKPTPTLAPPMPELPKPIPSKKAGRWVNQRQCGPNGCQIVPVWVEDGPVVTPAAPPIPAEADANRKKPASNGTPAGTVQGQWVQCGLFGRKWIWVQCQQ